MKRKKLSLLVLSTLPLILSSCGGNSALFPDSGTGDITVLGITMAQSKANVGVGKSITLKVSVAPYNATLGDLTWTSSNTSVATVNSSGKVDGVSAGTATITAKYGNFSTSCVVTVTSGSNYRQSLLDYSLANHVYVHYYRFAQSASDYNKFDIWAWPYRPNEGQGAKFDWTGRTTSLDGLSATGNAEIDSMGFATADIDLTKTYNGGWKAASTTMGGTNVKFDIPAEGVKTQIGLQIVQSESRISSSGFWKNDGGNIYANLANFSFDNKDGSKSYHIFMTQDSAANLQTIDDVAGGFIPVDPYANDDGTNYTYGKSEYVNANFTTDKAIQKTSKSFAEDAGVGYQVMVSSFADSDGDGFGDIYGITQKLDYLKELGVNVLWLTPIQKSDSYHGYDISDYLTVDAKYGSKNSTAAKANGGKVNEATAGADYKELIDSAHELGIKVIMDLVINHTSTSNNWFTKSAQLDQTMRAYYQWGNNVTDSNNINEDKYWYPYGDHVYSYYAKFGSSMPELNYQYQSTRDAVRDIALNWCSIGVDGFRMDAVKHIFLEEETYTSSGDTIITDITTKEGKEVSYSSNLTKNLNFWKELNYEVKKAYPNAYFVGENFDGHAYHVAPYYEGFDSLFDFYSYFNLTSMASSAAREKVYASTWSGAFDANKQASDGYQPSSEGGTSIKYGDQWSIKGVLNTYNKYRNGNNANVNATDGYQSLPGMFTSNHDIARTINRVAGTETNSDGLSAQGNVTSSTYADNDKRATLVQIAELMLPGTTYIYYGDELGMTGNFDAGIDANTGYADLAYRQPMKWNANGQVGDGSMTTGYGITGSEASVHSDEINSSNLVKSVAERNDNNHFNAIKKFANVKSNNETLIRGLYEPCSASEAKGHTLIFTRTLGDESYKVIVNFDDAQVSTGVTSGEVVASYGSATLTNVSGWSAVVIKTNGEINPPEPETKMTITASFSEASNYTGDLYAYAWNEAEVKNAQWPGQKMTYDASTKTYSLEIGESLTKIIFNDGNNRQTGNLDVSTLAKDFTLEATATTIKAAGQESLGSKTLYLDMGSQWSQADAKPYIYAFKGSSSTWISMTKVEGNVYRADVDLDAYDTIIFVRMNPSASEPSWDNKWNQTSDISISSLGDNNLITITGWDNNQTTGIYSK